MVGRHEGERAQVPAELLPNRLQIRGGEARVQRHREPLRRVLALLGAGAGRAPRPRQSGTGDDDEPSGRCSTAAPCRQRHSRHLASALAAAAGATTAQLNYRLRCDTVCDGRAGSARAALFSEPTEGRSALRQMTRAATDDTWRLTVFLSLCFLLHFSCSSFAWKAASLEDTWAISGGVSAYPRSYSSTGTSMVHVY